MTTVVIYCPACGKLLGAYKEKVRELVIENHRRVGPCLRLEDKNYRDPWDDRKVPQSGR